jgi:hypothetical protein
MPRRNPYDRRETRPGDVQAYTPHGQEHRPAGPLSIAELAAMVEAAHIRGQAEATARHRDQMAAAQANAWQEGHDAGVEAGREEQWLTMSDAITAAIPRDLLAELPAGPDRYPDRYSKKRIAPGRMWTLLLRCRAAFRVLASIEDAHRPPGDLPF